MISKRLRKMMLPVLIAMFAASMVLTACGDDNAINNNLDGNTELNTNLGDNGLGDNGLDNELGDNELGDNELGD